MKSVFSFFKNKYFLTLFIFLFYILFLDEFDIFSLISQKTKLNQLKIQRDQMNAELVSTRTTLKNLNNLDYLESYARSKKFFKKDDEEIFVITFEEKSK